MAKAHIRTPDGLEIKLEGTPQEIAAILEKSRIKAAESTPSTKRSISRHKGKTTLSGLLQDLQNQGFFKQPKGLNEVKKRLGDLGHSYPVTTLSGIMRTQVRRRTLRRFKEKGKYVYAQ